MTAPTAHPVQLYCGLMESVKSRTRFIERVVAGDLRIIADEQFAYETVAVQLRKILELIAFASLCAHKDKYAEAHANFANHWKAVKLLQDLERVHPEFYPQPVLPPVQKAPGRKYVGLVKDGYLTRSEFEVLYDKCSDIIHSRNPFSPASQHIDFVHPVPEWLRKIKTLLKFHQVRLVGSRELWLVSMAESDGKVHAYIANAI